MDTAMDTAMLQVDEMLLMNLRKIKLQVARQTEKKGKNKSKAAGKKGKGSKKGKAKKDGKKGSKADKKSKKKGNHAVVMNFPRDGILFKNFCHTA